MGHVHGPARSDHRPDAAGLAPRPLARRISAALSPVGGGGLWGGKRGAESLPVTGGLSLVPLELFELTRAVTPPRLTALVVNLAVVAYLIGRLRRRARATSNGGPGPGTFEA